MKKISNKNKYGIVLSIIFISLSILLGFLYTQKNLNMLIKVNKQLSYGSRYVGSNGHTKVKEYIASELGFSKAYVKKQEWLDKDSGYVLTNFVARFNQDAKERFVIATHYDTDPKATKDKNNKNMPVPGASDGASGVAVLLELARNFENLGIKKDIGIDLVFFDAENFEPGGFEQWSPKGSTYFSENLNDLYEAQPIKALVVDMVCDKNLNFRKESSSIKASEEDVTKLWNIGQRVSPNSFSNQIASEIKDDHTPLNKAGVPSILLIDLDYPYHNTTKDTIDKCSENSLSTTYKTVTEYIKNIK